MIFPNDSITVKGIRAVTGDSQLIATTTTEITILNVHLDKFQQASQLVQCSVNGGAPFTTLAQAVGSTTVQDVNMSWVLPVNTVCKLRTFDGTLTQAYITYVPYNLSTQSMIATTTQNFEVVGTIGVLFAIGVTCAVIIGTLVKKLT